MPRNPIRRRDLLKAGLVASIAATGMPQDGPPQGSSSPPGNVSLREKFFGCIAGCHIGSAMAAPVEGWSSERIEKEHGTLDRLLPY